LLAYCTATAMNAVEIRYGGIPERRRDQANLIAAATSLDMADWWEPTKDFLIRLSKAQILQAVAEGVSAEAADNTAGMKKDAMATNATSLLLGKRWLPLPLRGSGSRSPAEQVSLKT